MKSSRRTFDRSREPDLKKPRLAEELERGLNPSVRQFQQKSVPPATNLGQSRFRASDRDSESSDSGRGGYQPQPQQHHELVGRYKTALAELTFNSKPIITNLTIIAGENLHAAKAIAAIVCGNIIEVPTEQKLPSLYLLDSIVKNIGRDYIKYFAARLPEVFCKAYRQVDPSVHQSMRHLFGTWKGVFPPQSLQIIEKELAFVPAINGSASGSVTSRPDSQSQRPPRSIHVNPKYLEMQRLQQSSRVKGMTSDVTGVTTSLSEDAERPERAGNVSSGRPWMDAPVEMHDIQHSHRDALSGTTLEKKISVAYGGDYEYDNDVAKNSGLERRIIDTGHDKTWLGGSSNVAENFSQRNGFTNKHGISNYPSTKSVSSSAHLASMQNRAGRSSSALSTSWKNSEEEEFVWDDMNSKSSDYGAPSISKDPRKDHLNLDESERLSVSNHLCKLPQSVHNVGFTADRETSSDLFFSEQTELGPFGQRKSSPWQLQGSPLLDEPLGSGNPTVNSGPSEGYAANLSGTVSGATSTLARIGGRSQMGSSNLAASGSGLLKNAVSGSVGSGGQPGQSRVSQKSPSPSLPVHLPSHQLLSSTELEEPQIHPLPHPDRKASSFSGNLSVGPSNLQKTQPQHSQLSSFSLQLSQPRHQFPISHSQQDSMRSEVSGQTQKKPLLPPLSNHGTPTVGNSSSDRLTAETSGKLAAIMNSGIFSNNSNRSSSSVPNSSFQEMELMEPDISGPSPTKLASSEPTSGSLPPTSTLKLTNLSSLGSVSQGTSNVVNNSLNPVSNLLSSLVAKGLISASKSEMPNITTHQTPARLEIQKSRDAVASSIPVNSVPISSVIPSSTRDEMSFSEPADKSSGILPQPTTSEINSLIGFEFRPDVIRELHPPVISKLFDDIPHQCSICGVRLKLQEQLDRHLQSHASKFFETNCMNKGSRRWYPNSNEWIAGKAGLLSESESAGSTDEPRETENKNDEPMVPADEDQFACVLCGQFFEDLYCLERDEWMFKGAVHMTISTGDVEVGSTNESITRGPIVHANCITGSSVHNERLSTVIEAERDM